MADMECPYCGADQTVCHDDGAGYSEGQFVDMDIIVSWEDKA